MDVFFFPFDFFLIHIVKWPLEQLAKVLLSRKYNKLWMFFWLLNLSVDFLLLVLFCQAGGIFPWRATLGWQIFTVIQPTYSTETIREMRSCSHRLVVVKAAGVEQGHVDIYSCHKNSADWRMSFIICISLTASDHSLCVIGKLANMCIKNHCNTEIVKHLTPLWQKCQMQHGKI